MNYDVIRMAQEAYVLHALCRRNVLDGHMTQDDIIRMARETGNTKWYGTHPDGTSDFLGAEFTLEQLKRFVELVRANDHDLWQQVEVYLLAASDGSMSRNNSESLASELLNQIRARGNT